MTVTVNESPLDLPDASDLGHLLREMGIEAKPGVAVAVNGNVVAKADWETTTLCSNDRILLIQATQGG